MTIRSSDIPVEKFCVTKDEASTIREHMSIMVQRIVTAYMPLFQPLEDNVIKSTKHAFHAESCEKSELFNIGVLDEPPSSIAGVIKILEGLQKYVPLKEDGDPFRIITWDDGLSCERHVDAQNARANGATPLDRLQGLEPAPQEFHKRMLLMQDTMNKMFSGSSATEKGTLFHLKKVFNQRSVSKNVSETFNYVSDFLKELFYHLISLNPNRALTCTYNKNHNNNITTTAHR
ncbi:hypothetical protein DPMN_045040 [Dreissena polymorpha]|uniref:DUF6589 domain-containing protein n=1 Tax=Dreissena polymorpha TaxID=45954 RepID=A0A9D4D434_DREPO|nr:hypothetical protein DPMN_045040 [Dreissena polymorpha]